MRHSIAPQIIPVVAAATLLLVAGACSEDSAQRLDGASADDAVSDATTGDAPPALTDGRPADGQSQADGTVSGPDPTCPGGEGDGQRPNGTISGSVTTPHPTLNNIAVEWAIQGDSNLDGAVRVRYREQGTPTWKLGMPLRRIPADSNEGFSWANRHSGSIFDLQPGTGYEIELWLVDPDGGCRVSTRTVTTRPLPEPMVGAPIKPVTPATLAAALSAAQPGEIIDLAAGTYHGFAIAKDGTAGKELVIRSTAGAVVNGTVDASDRQYVQIVGLSANRIRFDRSRRVSIMNNKVTLVGKFDGIGAWNRAEDAYIADNIVTGTTAWTEPALGANGTNEGECILVTGPGHVIAHNKVTGCRDNISFLEGSGAAVDQYSIDVIDNDVYNAADDGVEADFCVHNCRIMRNRFTNVFIAMSSQPGLGGPTYFIRNVVYNNVFNAVFKLNRGSIGDVALHNTVVKLGDALAGTPGRTHARQYFRNNVFIGGTGGTYHGWSSGEGRIVYMPDAAPNGSYDYDGFGSLVGEYSGRIEEVSFANFAELRSKTTYKHAVEVDLSIFAAAVPVLENPFPARSPVDLRLDANGAAVDRGEVIPNVTDGYTGQAPDLGAYEHGQGPPAYGPR